MSRLTASPFHKPSPFEFPRAPPSPPETHSDTITGPNHIMTSAHILAAQDLGMVDPGLVGVSPDTPSRVKRSGSIPYHNTGFRETKERTSQRTGKSLIIVIPPSTLIQEHGQHGHTVSNGPYHRLSQGVVMPLFPSMFAQLTAIAREFNFPSTSGLCLYFHYVEDGFTLTPRISDDSWQTLWGHLSEPLLPNERRPLIGGKVEFDIDLRLARWYSAWLSSIHREFSDHPSHYYPSTAPSLAHYRRESSLADSRQFEEDPAENSVIHQHSAPIGRHVPRKLSLVERFDVSSSSRPDVKANPRPVIPPAETVSSTSHVLSTILQEDEPKTAKQHLDTRVNSWRASAVLSPTPLAATGQTSLDPSNLPNNVPIDTPVETPSSPVEEEMKLEDYTWSISSAGPRSCGEVSPTAWYRAPSVHVANRVEGSVCTSPSICTSFGPLEDDYDIYFTSTTPRIPSPDLAERFYEDSPPTPMTATSWGAPLSYPSSPAYHYSIPSPDIALRFYEESPPTPMTATSWGAPLSYPPSPRCVSPTPSLDIAERMRFEELGLSMTEHSRSPWSHVWPYTDGHYRTSIPSNEKPWLHVWPYNIGRSRKPLNKTWPHIWPYTSEQYKASVGVRDSTGALSGRNPWSHLWPYNSDRSRNPSNSPWSHVWPYTIQQSVRDIQSKIAVKLAAEYPIIDIYPPVYPHNLDNIYLAPLNIPSSHPWPYASQKYVQDIQSKIEVRLPAEYPMINIYPPVYPHNIDNIYPTIAPSHILPYTSQQPAQNTLSSIEVELPAEYPTIHLYRAVYPHNLDNIYPTHPVVIESREGNAHPQEEYPFFNLYPPISAPYFAHFLLHMCNPRSEYPDFDIYPEILTPANLNPEGSAQLVYSWKYPVFNIYPPVYPYFDLYPYVERGIQTKLSHGRRQILQTTLNATYPFFDLYPTVYPHFNIYPSLYANFDKEAGQSGDKKKLSLSVTLPPIYPSLHLYPAVYPHFDIYPTLYGSMEGMEHEESERALTPAPGLIYPYFNLYPGVYPHLDLYPTPYGLVQEKADKHDIRPLASTSALTYPYPHFNLYPGVYPHLDIYPAPYFSTVSPASNPIIRYPHFDLYPALEKSSREARAKPTSSRIGAQYPFFNLYPAVYPYFDLYLPQLELSLVPPKKVKSSSRLTHLELHAMVMMERQGSFGQSDSLPGENGAVVSSQMSLINEDKEIGHYLQETSASNAARNIRLSSTPQSRDRRVPSMAYKSGSMVFLPNPTNTGQQSNSPSVRKSMNFPEREISRASSLREQQNPRVSIALPPKLGPSRRDSLVLQRVKAFDHHSENSTGLSKETLAKFPMPPRVFPPLPPLPTNRR